MEHTYFPEAVIAMRSQRSSVKSSSFPMHCKMHNLRGRELNPGLPLAGRNADHNATADSLLIASSAAIFA